MADNNEESANANEDGAGESESSAANGDGASGNGANGNGDSGNGANENSASDSAAGQPANQSANQTDSAAGNTSGNTAVEAPPAGKTTDRLRNVMLFAVFPVLILFVAIGVVFALTDDSDDSDHKTSDSAFVSPAVMLDYLAEGRTLGEISEITGVHEEQLLHILANPRRNSDFPQNDYYEDGHDKDGYEDDWFYYEDGHGKDGYEDDYHYEDGYGDDYYEDTHKGDHEGEGEGRELERGITPFRDRVERFRDQHQGEGEGREPERGVAPFRDRVERFRDQHEGGHDEGGHDDGNQDDYSDNDRGGRAEIRRFGILPDASIDDLLDLLFGFQDFDDREDSGFDGGNDRGFDDGNDRDFDGNDRGETGSVEPGSEIDRGETGSETDRRGEPGSEPIVCDIPGVDTGNVPDSLGLVGYFGITLISDEKLQELFGLTRNEISERTARGVTLAELAEANGVSEGQLIETLTTELSERSEQFGIELTRQEREELVNGIRQAIHCPPPSPSV